MLSGCFLFSHSLTAEKRQNWKSHPPYPQGNILRSIATPDSNTIIMAGDAGTIIKSTDGGTNWSILSTGITADLYSISFLDANSGFAVGTDGTIIGDSSRIIFSEDQGNNRDSFGDSINVPQNL